jgi:hypothetical protein
MFAGREVQGNREWRRLIGAHRGTFADGSYEAVSTTKTIRRYIETVLINARGPRSYLIGRIGARAR